MYRQTLKSKFNYLLYFLAIYLLLKTFLLSASASTLPQWENNTAEVELIKYNISDFETEGTVLSQLIQATGKSLNELVEQNQKYFVTFSLVYSASIKLKGEKTAKIRKITQYGLYRSLDPRIQSSLPLNSTSNQIKIRYASSDPVALQFIINNDAIEAPPLLTNIIDAGWEKKMD